MDPINLEDSLRSDRIGMALAAVNGVMGDRFRANNSPLVPIGSAQARSALHGHLPSPPNLQQNSALIPGVKHIALAHNIEVYAQLKAWLIEGEKQPQQLAYA